MSINTVAQCNTAAVRGKLGSRNRLDTHMLGMLAADGTWMLCERGIFGYKQGLTMQLLLVPPGSVSGVTCSGSDLRYMSKPNRRIIY
jgi:hypothetical protein